MAFPPFKAPRVDYGTEFEDSPADLSLAPGKGPAGQRGSPVDLFQAVANFLIRKAGAEYVFILFRLNKHGIPHCLIRFYELVLKDTVEYFERGKAVRKGIREASRAISKAIKIAKKNKRNPGEKIARSLDALKGFSEEVEYTRKALRATYVGMENALDKIKEERIDEARTLIEKARELFLKNNFEKGIKLLEASREKVSKKVLAKTRTALFGGISSEVKNLKEEIEKRTRRKPT